jgi:glycerol-3-phosphate dehydrogenase
MQGVDVALVERDDFVSGASAASSHMIHGGIRYLENGEFRLVHEAVTERNGLLRTRRTTCGRCRRRSRSSRPSRGARRAAAVPAPRRGLAHRAGAALIKIGLVIYDSFSRGGGRVPRHDFHGRASRSRSCRTSTRT